MQLSELVLSSWQNFELKNKFYNIFYDFLKIIHHRLNPIELIYLADILFKKTKIIRTQNHIKKNTEYVI